jgi:high-affinity K+ transport system ATPase subunit B
MAAIMWCCYFNKFNSTPIGEMVSLCVAIINNSIGEILCFVNIAAENVRIITH